MSLVKALVKSALFFLSIALPISRRPALVLDQLCERNALGRGVEFRRRGKTLLNLAELVVCERPITDFAGIGQLEMSSFGRA